MTRWLILGGKGLLGRELTAALGERDARSLGRDDVDLTDPGAVRRAVAHADVVVNAAAFTAVDAAEHSEDEAMAVNAVGAGDLARASAEAGARLVHISTDYVFSGTGTEPYAEDAPLDPLGAYGRSKAEGERRVRAQHPDGSWIIRTAWLYGAGASDFPHAILRLVRDQGTAAVVDDQIGQPTWARDVARRIIDTVDADARAGTYHATSSGRTTWYGFARALVELAGIDPAAITPTTSSAFPRPAPRPAWSVLGHDAWARAGLDPIGEWRSRLGVAFSAGGLA